MAHAKNNASFPDRGLYLEAITQARSHWFLAQYVITLCRKGQHDVSMHMILHGNDNAIGQSPSQSLDGLSGCVQEAFPVAENQGVIDVVGLREELACLWTRLGDSYNLARHAPIVESMRSIVLI